jgi:hypothetical protein
MIVAKKRAEEGEQGEKRKGKGGGRGEERGREREREEREREREGERRERERTISGCDHSLLFLSLSHSPSLPPSLPLPSLLECLRGEQKVRRRGEREGKEQREMSEVDPYLGLLGGSHGL